MKRACVLVVFIMIASITIPMRAKQKEIIGYYPSWKWKSSANIMTPGRLPFKKLTIINYAFFYPLANGNLVGRDSIGDDLILNGERDNQTGGYKSGTALVELAHKNGVKVVLSVGGWDDSYNFPEVALNETNRQQFAHSCVEQLRKYRFDGIDIDWEFPCLVDHKGTPNDKFNNTKLIKITKDSLDSFGKQVGRHYLLTAALPAVEAGTKNFEMEKVSELLDMLNIMTYDLNGEWDSLSGHNAPLYAPNKSDTLRNINAAFKLFTDVYSVPAAKINIGVPFYGHTYRDCTALYALHKGIDTVHFSHQGCFYYDIIQCRDKFTRKWDDRAKAPYLISSSWNELISYDDEESVGYKAQYVVDQHACGLIIWEITGDYLTNGSTPLLDAIYGKFKDTLSK